MENEKKLKQINKNMKKYIKKIKKYNYIDGKEKFDEIKDRYFDEGYGLFDFYINELNIDINYIINNINYMNKEQIDLLVKTIAATKDGDLIVYFVYNVKDLSKENIDVLVKTVAELEGFLWAMRIIHDCKNLTNVNKNILINKIVKGCKDYPSDFKQVYLTYSAENADNTDLEVLAKAFLETPLLDYQSPISYYDFALATNGRLSKEILNKFVKKIVQTKYPDEYTITIMNAFLCDIKNLSESAQKELQDYMHPFWRLLSLNKAQPKVIYEFIIENYDFLKLFSESKYLYILRDRIIKSKNKIYIAKILYFMKDVNLINKLFGSMDNYLSYCKLHQKELDINLNEVEQKLYISYVDDNVDKYLEEEKGNAKSLKV